MSTAYKKMTSNGSISIPVAMRRELGIEPKDPMIVEEHQGEIRIKPYTLRCNFCGTTEDVHEGEAENIRGDIAFAQSCLETGNFTFSGSAVELSQNNFCGMGVTQNGETGNSFKTPQLGIRAQIQHLNRKE